MIPIAFRALCTRHFSCGMRQPQSGLVTFSFFAAMVQTSMLLLLLGVLASCAVVCVADEPHVVGQLVAKSEWVYEDDHGELTGDRTYYLDAAKGRARRDSGKVPEFIWVDGMFYSFESRAGHVIRCSKLKSKHMPEKNRNFNPTANLGKFHKTGTTDYKEHKNCDKWMHVYDSGADELYFDQGASAIIAEVDYGQTMGEDFVNTETYTEWSEEAPSDDSLFDIDALLKKYAIEC